MPETHGGTPMKRIIGDRRTLIQRLHLNDRAMEWFSAGVMLSWATTLAYPGDTLASPSFSAFHRFGLTETFWVWAFACCGAGRMVALAINGAMQPTTPIIRMIGAMVGAWSWAQVSMLITEGTFLQTGTPSTGSGVYALLALAEAISVYRAAVDVRTQPE